MSSFGGTDDPFEFFTIQQRVALLEAQIKRADKRVDQLSGMIRGLDVRLNTIMAHLAYQTRAIAPEGAETKPAPKRRRSKKTEA